MDILSQFNQFISHISQEVQNWQILAKLQVTGAGDEIFLAGHTSFSNVRKQKFHHAGQVIKCNELIELAQQ